MFDGNSTDLGFSSHDGDDVVVIKDLDGSTTGSAGSFVVKPLPFHLTDQCKEIDNWKMAVCPHQYGQVSCLFKNWGFPKLFKMSVSSTSS